jgi:hypothetical protein
MACTNGSYPYQGPKVAPNMLSSTCDNTKIIHILHTKYLSPHKQYHPHENPQTTYTSYMRVHKHTPYLRIEVIHIVDKHSHIFDT